MKKVPLGARPGELLDKPRTLLGQWCFVLVHIRKVLYTYMRRNLLQMRYNLSQSV